MNMMLAKENAAEKEKRREREQVEEAAGAMKEMMEQEPSIEQSVGAEKESPRQVLGPQDNYEME